MCGIAGCYQQPDGQRLVDAMADRLAHRGPDARRRRTSYDRRRGRRAPRRTGGCRSSTCPRRPTSRSSRTGWSSSTTASSTTTASCGPSCEAAGVRFRTSSDTEVVLEAWRRWGAGRARAASAACSRSRSSTSAPAACAWPATSSASSRCTSCAAATGVVFASELKAIVAARRPRARASSPAALVASMLYYWVPEQRCAVEGVEKLPPGSWAEFRPGRRRARRSGTGTPAEVRRTRPRPDRPPTSARSSRTRWRPTWSPTCRSSTFLSGGLDSSIVTVLAHAPRPGDRRLHHHLPARGPAPRGDARRRASTPARCAAQFGIDAARDRDQPGRRRHAAADGRHARRADRRPGRDQHPAHLRGGPRRRRQGAAVRHGRRRAVRRLPQAPAPACSGARYQRLPGALRAGVVAPDGRTGCPVAVGGRGLRSARWAKRFLTFAELPEEAAFRRSYTLYDRGRARRPARPRPARRTSTDVIDEHRAIYDDTTLADHVNRMCLADARLFLPGLNLAYTDRASMAASTEVRVPFVDVEVVAGGVLRSRAGDKIRGRERKGRAQERPPSVAARARSSTGRRPRSARRCGPGSRNDLRDARRRRPRRTASWCRPGFLRPDALRAADRRPARRAARTSPSRSGSCSVLELWYRNARAAGVGAA